LEPADAQAMSASILESKAHLETFLPWAKHGHNDPEEVLLTIRKFRSEYDAGRDYPMGIFDRQTGEHLGGTGFHNRVGPLAMEIGYWVNARHLQKGIATEASMALCKVGFELEGLRKMVLRMDPANLISAKVPEKLGFSLEGRIREALMDSQGNWKDVLQYSLLLEEYHQKPWREIDLEAFDILGRKISMP
jgi:RimJ/RimL family protein N-acetyltransferase